MNKLFALAAVFGLFAATTASANEAPKAPAAAPEAKAVDCKTLAEGSKERADCEAKAAEGKKEEKK